MARQDRISSLLKSEIATLLRNKINDDRIGFISITDVTVSKKHDHAYVYYSQIGTPEEKERTKKGLASASKFLHAELSKIIRYMAVPKLHFRFDDSIERGVETLNKINSLS